MWLRLSQFVKVANISQVPEGKMMKFEVAGEEALVTKVDGKFYAIGNVCTHRGGPLNEGELEGTTVTCPWHGGQFDITSGLAVGPPAISPEPKYGVKVEGNSILLKKA